MRSPLAWSFLLVAACASGSTTGDGPDAARVDATAVDSASVDGPVVVIDASAVDATAVDATSIDAGTPIDATPIDAAIPIDAMPIDGGGGTVPDTCAQAQNLTAAALGAGVTVTGTTVGAVDDVNPSSACTGYTPDGPDHVYVVNLTAGQRVTATATPTAWDLSLELVTPCQTTPATCTGADAGFSGDPETATLLASAATTVYIVVDGYNPGVAGPYSLLVRIQ